VLLNLGEPGGFDIAPWADRVQLIDTKYVGTWELPALGAVAAPNAVLIRPDGYVAWVGVGDRTHLGLTSALTTWFGPPTAAQRTGVQAHSVRSSTPRALGQGSEDGAEHRVGRHLLREDAARAQKRRPPTRATRGVNPVGPRHERPQHGVLELRGKDAARDAATSERRERGPEGRAVDQVEGHADRAAHPRPPRRERLRQATKQLDVGEPGTADASEPRLGGRPGPGGDHPRRGAGPRGRT